MRLVHFKRQNAAVLRNNLKKKLAKARKLTDSLLAMVKPHALYERPIAERHRFIFYLGHMDTFDWNLLCRDLMGARSLSLELERLFAFGVDPAYGAGPQESQRHWPSQQSVQLWNSLLREHVDQVVDGAPFDGWLEQGWALRLCIEHRLMHAETLCYMLHQLSYGSKRLGLTPALVDAQEPKNDWVTIPGGEATLGLSRGAAPFVGWDNEYDTYQCWVPVFRIQRFPVTNGEFLKFVSEGGYQERSFWSEEDWNWRVRAGVDHPAFWQLSDSGWVWRAMFTCVPLPKAWPVFVSHAEACAYARYAGKQLPSEAQWHRAALGTPSGVEREFPWGDDLGAVSNSQAGLGGNCYDPVPVHAHPLARSAFGVHGLVGNGWNWTSTLFAPFPGFAPQPFYPGYSADFFDGRHFVMKGASPRTDRGLIRGSFRNWFQSHYPFVYASFRCAETS